MMEETGLSEQAVLDIEGGEIDSIAIDGLAMYVTALGGHMGYGYEIDGEVYPFTPEV